MGERLWLEMTTKQAETLWQLLDREATSGHEGPPVTRCRQMRARLERAIVRRNAGHRDIVVPLTEHQAERLWWAAEGCADRDQNPGERYWQAIRARVAKALGGEWPKRGRPARG